MSAAERPTSYTELAAVVAAMPMLMREARRARGLSLRGAASQIGVSFNTVTRIEQAQGIHSDSLVAVLRWLDQSTPPQPAH